jgi:microcompartment protein CcmL/EutN
MVYIASKNMATPKAIPLIASMVQGDFSEVKMGNEVGNAVAGATIFVESIIIDRIMSSLERVRE